MEKKTKTIVIVAIVALVVWYLWKKGVFGKGSGSSSGSSNSSAPAGVDLNSVESIIAASGMTSSDAAAVRKFANSVNSSLVKQQKMERKAAERGYTYAQMLVLDGLWTVYCTMDGDKSVLKPEYANDSTAKNYYWKVSKTIMNL